MVQTVRVDSNYCGSGGSVTAVTNVSSTTIQEYQIGDVLSAADANLGGNGGSGFQLPLMVVVTV